MSTKNTEIKRNALAIVFPIAIGIGVAITTKNAFDIHGLKVDAAQTATILQNLSEDLKTPLR